MTAVVTTAARLLAGGRRRAALDLSLTAVGVAVSVAITLLVLGAFHGLDVRDARSAWREPRPVDPAAATALQQRTAEVLGDAVVDVVRFRPLAAEVPPPPGVAALPAPGEVVVSPALAALLDTAAEAAQLRARLGGDVAGTIGAEGLAHAEELVAVVTDPGLEPTPDDAVPAVDHRLLGPVEPSPVLPVDGYADHDPDPAIDPAYRMMAGVAGMLLVGPAVLLLGAAARFTAARRATRLAGLRLAGASPGQITGIATVETAVGAGVGALVGVLLAALGRWVLDGTPLAGGPFTAADLDPGLPTTVAVVAGALVVAVAATLAGLRRVRTSPLGVVQAVGVRRPRAVRLLVTLLLWAGFGVAAVLVASGAGTVLLVVGLGGVIATASIAGPWVTWLLGAVGGRLARRPTTLVAARRTTADPAGAFRPASPLVLTAFTGGFLLVVTGVLALNVVDVDGGDALVLPEATSAEAAEAAIAAAGVDATVDAAADPARVVVGAGSTLEEVRTALDEVTDPHVATVEGMDLWDLETVLGDVRRGLWIVLALALLQSATTTAVAAAAAVLEQGPTLAALRLTGMPVGDMLRVRILQAAVPVGVVAAVATAVGVAAGIAVIAASGPAGLVVGLPELVGPPLVVLAATAAAAAGAALAWPVLRDVTARPLAER